MCPDIISLVHTSSYLYRIAAINFHNVHSVLRLFMFNEDLLQIMKHDINLTDKDCDLESHSMRQTNVLYIPPATSCIACILISL